MVKNIVCTVCPKGCRITAVMEGENVVEVTGHTCKRGEVYAEAECTNPVRVLTTTAMTDKGNVISVKTKEAVPKKLMYECMEAVNGIVIKTPVKVGDVVMDDICGTGVSVIATRSAE